MGASSISEVRIILPPSLLPTFLTTRPEFAYRTEKIEKETDPDSRSRQYGHMLGANPFVPGRPL